jgi:hypothetical protein
VSLSGANGTRGAGVQAACGLKTGTPAITRQCEGFFFFFFLRSTVRKLNAMAQFSTRTQNVKFAPLGTDQALSNKKNILQPGAKRQCPPSPRFLPPIFANKSRKILSVLGKDQHGARHSVKVSKEDEQFLQAESAANHKKTSWTVFYKVSMHV